MLKRTVKKTIKPTSIKDIRPEPEVEAWNHNPCRVGYWHEKGDRDNKWPLKPVCDPKRKNKLVLKRLDKLEEKAHRRVFKGWSTCRICGKKNGSAEFDLTIKGIKYIWPSGLRHYLSAHKMIPSGALYNLLDLQPKGTHLKVK